MNVVAPIPTSSVNRPVECSATVLSDAIANGTIKAMQVSIWARAKKTAVYAWARNSTRITADAVQLIWRYAPMPLLVLWVQVMTWGRVRVLPAESPTLAELDIDGRPGLTLDDVEQQFRLIDEHKLDAQMVMAEDASLERRMSAADEASRKISRRAYLIEETLRHEALKLN